MQQTPHIHAAQRNGNLHIKLEGLFTTDTAAELTMIMAESYTGKGNIFIHTAELTGVEPESGYMFNNLLGTSGLPQKNVYLTGEKGMDISPAAGKVILYKKKKHGHVCCGRCKNCTCDKTKAS